MVTITPELIVNINRQTKRKHYPDECPDCAGTLVRIPYAGTPQRPICEVKCTKCNTHHPRILPLKKYPIVGLTDFAAKFNYHLNRPMTF